MQTKGKARLRPRYEPGCYDELSGKYTQNKRYFLDRHDLKKLDGREINEKIA